MQRKKWTRDGYDFSWRKGPGSLGVLSITGGKLIQAFHMLLPLAKAHRMTAEIVMTFQLDRLPLEGQFRRMAKGRPGKLVLHVTAFGTPITAHFRR